MDNTVEVSRRLVWVGVAIVIAIAVVGYLVWSNIPNVTSKGPAALGSSFVANGVTITPREVVSDSRCPIDVTCIQAGTVQVRTTISYGGVSTEKVITLGVVAQVSDLLIVMTEVTPNRHATSALAASDYVFTFVVNKNI